MNKKAVEQGLAILFFSVLIILIYIAGTYLALSQIDNVQDSAKVSAGRVVFEPGYIAPILWDQPLGQETLYELVRTTDAEDEDAWERIAQQLSELLQDLSVAGEQDSLAVLVFKDNELVICATPQEPTALPESCAGMDAETARDEVVQQALFLPIAAAAPLPGGMLLGVVII